MSADQRDPTDEVAPLNAGGSGPQELGEDDLEDAAGGCGTFHCTIFRLANSPDET